MIGGNPKYGDELRPIADALHAAADAIAMQADRYRWRGESEHEFERRQRWQMKHVRDLKSLRLRADHHRDGAWILEYQ